MYSVCSLQRELSNQPNQTRNQQQRFMQNKPNLRNVQMNISAVKTKDYENKTALELQKNKPKTNPIKPNFYTKKHAHCL